MALETQLTEHLWVDEAILVARDEDAFAWHLDAQRYYKSSEFAESAMEELGRALLAERQEAARYRAALEQINREAGITCGRVGATELSCSHPVCRASFDARQIAQQALAEGESGDGSD